MNLPRPGVKPVSPARAGRLLTTGPPGKSSASFLRSAAAAAFRSDFFFPDSCRVFPISQFASHHMLTPLLLQGRSTATLCQYNAMNTLVRIFLWPRLRMSSGSVTNDGFAELLSVCTFNSAKYGQTVLRRLCPSHSLQL